MSIENIVEEFNKLQVNSSTDSQIPLTSNIQENQSNSSNSSLNIGSFRLNNLLIMAFKPEYLNCVPNFDGNPSELNRYLSTCESIITTFYDRQNLNNFQNVYILNSLISKLSGNARSVVNIQNCSNWDDLKTTLYRNFADQRDEACLNRDLVLLRQNANEKVNHFYDRILEILNLLCSFVDIHETTPESKQLKRTLYTKLALKTFICGLKEPLGTTIRCMRPQTLEEAMQFIRDEENTSYFQTVSNRNNYKPNPTQNQLNHSPLQRNFNNQNQSLPRNFSNQNQYNIPSQSRNFSSQYQPNRYPNNNNNYQNKPFPSQPIKIQPQYVPQRRLPTGSEVFGSPQQQNTNVFKPNQNKSLPTPTPMSVSTRQTNRSEMYNTNVEDVPEFYESRDQNYDEMHHEDDENLIQIENNDQDIPENFTDVVSPTMQP